MNVLITGAGLIGCHFAKRAADAGNRVAIYDLSPNREYIDKIVGRDRAEIVAADMRDLQIGSPATPRGAPPTPATESLFTIFPPTASTSTRSSAATAPRSSPPTCATSRLC